MDIENTRLAAIKSLLDDEEQRRVRENWEAILADTSLTPPTKTLQREKRKKTGRSGGFIPIQMRISPDIGRFLFACFKWHGFNPSQTSAKIESKGLEDLAEAFNFKIDPMENQRQFISDEERKAAIEKEEGASYNLRVWGLIMGGLIITFGMVIRYLLRKSGAY